MPPVRRRYSRLWSPVSPPSLPIAYFGLFCVLVCRPNVVDVNQKLDEVCEKAQKLWAMRQANKNKKSEKKRLKRERQRANRLKGDMNGVGGGAGSEQKDAAASDSASAGAGASGTSQSKRNRNRKKRKKKKEAAAKKRAAAAAAQEAAEQAVQEATGEAPQSPRTPSDSTSPDVTPPIPTPSENSESKEPNISKLMIAVRLHPNVGFTNVPERFTIAFSRRSSSCCSTDATIADSDARRRQINAGQATEDAARAERRRYRTGVPPLLLRVS